VTANGANRRFVFDLSGEFCRALAGNAFFPLIDHPALAAGQIFAPFCTESRVAAEIGQSYNRRVSHQAEESPGANSVACHRVHGGNLRRLLTSSSARTR